METNSEAMKIPASGMKSLEDLIKWLDNEKIYEHTTPTKWIPDALIAAIAIANGLELFTYNKKDFDFIPELKLYRP